MSRHTKGPWKVLSWNGGRQLDIVDAEKEPVAVAFARGERGANANLIAASPEGYELLASMREWAEQEADDPASEDRPFAVKILAYLAKAEGRQS